MANGTTDYTLGGLNARMNNAEKNIECLTEVQKQQQSIIDNHVGGLNTIKWMIGAVGGVVIIQTVATIIKTIN